MDGFNEIKDKLPYKLPKLIITGDKPINIDNYASKQLILSEYNAHDPVKMNMVA